MSESLSPLSRQPVINAAQTKQHLVALVRAAHAVTIRWNCGGDDACVYTSVDEVEVQPPFAAELGKTVFFEHEWEPPYRAVYVDRQGQELGVFGENNFVEGTAGGRFFLEGNAVGLENEPAAEVYWEQGEYNELTAQELAALAALGVERSALAAELTTPAELADPAETGGRPDARMSAAFAGRRILFTLPH